MKKSLAVFCGAYCLTILLLNCGPDHKSKKTAYTSQLSGAGEGTIVMPTVSTMTYTASGGCKSYSESLPSHIKKGVIIVPLDWDNPSTSEKIVVSFFYRAAKDAKDAREFPLAFFNGGPAADSHSSISVIDANQAYDAFNIFFIDQRGTGCSSVFPTFGDNLSGVSQLKYYGISSIVKDAEAIRQFYRSDEPWIIYGQSFGGSILAKYLSIAPEGIKAVFMHGGTVDVSYEIFVENRIYGQQRVAEYYFKDYPNDLKILSKLRSLVKDSDCFSFGKTEICGAAVFDAFFINMGFKDSWKNLHKDISDLGSIPFLNRLFLLPIIQSQIMPRIDASITLEAIALGNLVAGGDIRQLCSDGIMNLDKKGLNIDSIPILDCRLIGHTHFSWDETLATFSESDEITFSELTEAIDNNPSIPIYMYSGEYDSFVPKESMNDLLNWAGTRVHYHHFPDTGHDGYYRESGVADDIKSVNPTMK